MDRYPLDVLGRSTYEEMKQVAEKPSEAVIADLPQSSFIEARARISSTTDLDSATNPVDTIQASRGVSDLKKRCGVCAAELTKYTCPECHQRTCSLDCVREHKTRFNCSGIPRITKHLNLNDYTGLQIQRDYHFLEDCKRIIDNAQRSFDVSNVPRHRLHNLPPNLRSLREEAKKRGVICQIMSEGMQKRDENTSRYDRQNNTITWKCKFVFCPLGSVQADAGSVEADRPFAVSTNWGSERHKLGHILQYCWAINPPLLCFHINRSYNKLSKYVSSFVSVEAVDQDNVSKKTNSDLYRNSSSTMPVVTCATTQGISCPPFSTVRPTQEQLPQRCFANSSKADDGVSVDREKVEASALSRLVSTSSLLEQEPGTRVKVESFLSAGPCVILAKAERLGNNEKYFCLNPGDTLNEALRLLFFINEYPVFTVVYESDLPNYPLVTDEDKEAIRASFYTTIKPTAQASDSLERIADRNFGSLFGNRKQRCLSQGGTHSKSSAGYQKCHRFSRKHPHACVGTRSKRFRERDTNPTSLEPLVGARPTRTSSAPSTSPE